MRLSRHEGRPALPRHRHPGAAAAFVSVALATLPALPAPGGPQGEAAAEPGPAEGYALVGQLSSEDRQARREAAERLVAAGDESLVPGLVDSMFFTPRFYRGDVVRVLEELTGEALGKRYHEWVEYVGERTDLVPAAGYMELKLSLLSRIDPRYAAVFYPGAPARIRLEEIVWGGVKLDGIPSLDDPRHVPASEAGYLKDRERVFGVSLGGEHRAYPRRILSWHEMLNDVVGGEPVVLSYCTLCGSGILYSTRTPSGEARTFGTSGLLYRSNKLMYDRQSYTLWSNLTGEPVVGRLARSPAGLPMLPMTLTTWGEWRTLHPDTTVLTLDREMERRWGFDYQPGAADRARRGVEFPVWQRDDTLERDAEVYALRAGAAAKAYPVERVVEEGVVNDAVGDLAVVLVGERESGAVRSYRRGELTFRAGPAAGELLDGAGRAWRVTEGALVPGEAAAAAGLAPLPREPGHVAFWFGWYGFYPHTEVYTGSG